jgi:hypothetical protein
MAQTIKVTEKEKNEWNGSNKNTEATETGKVIFRGATSLPLLRPLQPIVWTVLRSAVTQQRSYLYYSARNLCCCNEEVSLSTMAVCVMQRLLLRAFVLVVFLVRLPFVLDVGNTYFLSSSQARVTPFPKFTVNCTFRCFLLFLHSCDGCRSSQCTDIAFLLVLLNDDLQIIHKKWRWMAERN